MLHAAPLAGACAGAIKNAAETGNAAAARNAEAFIDTGIVKSSLSNAPSLRLDVRHKKPLDKCGYKTVIFAHFCSQSVCSKHGGSDEAHGAARPL